MLNLMIILLDVFHLGFFLSCSLSHRSEGNLWNIGKCHHLVCLHKCRMTQGGGRMALLSMVLIRASLDQRPVFWAWGAWNPCPGSYMIPALLKTAVSMSVMCIFRPSSSEVHTRAQHSETKREQTIGPPSCLGVSPENYAEWMKANPEG